MTDAEAKDESKTAWAKMDYDVTVVSREFLQHALQALADRVALVAALDDEFETVADVHKHTYGTISAARRHMEGQP